MSKTPPGTTQRKVAKATAKALAFGMLLLGAAMAAMAFVAPVDAAARAAEVIAGAAAAIGGAFLFARSRSANSAGATAGGLMLLASLVYLAVTNTEFHQGGVGYGIAVAQFVTVPIGLVLGGTAFAVSRPVHDATRPMGLGDFVPEGVILVVGTILLGIGLGQIGNERLMPPKWNWVSFLGLTVTGMFVLIALRGMLKSMLSRDRPSRWPRRFLGVLATDLVLVAGLGVMLYGALNNLVLGANGFRTGFAGNEDGLMLWTAAALFLIVVRGGFKLAVGNEAGTGAAAVRELLYVIGAIAFIVGERSVLLGKPPGVSIGGAFPAAGVILLGAFFLLVAARITAKGAGLQKRHEAHLGFSGPPASVPGR